MILNLKSVPTDREFEDNVFLWVLQETTNQNRNTPQLDVKSNVIYFPKFDFYNGFPPLLLKSKVFSI